VGHRANAGGAEVREQASAPLSAEQIDESPRATVSESRRY
jgi:hypothetical protein